MKLYFVVLQSPLRDLIKSLQRDIYWIVQKRKKECKKDKYSLTELFCTIFLFVKRERFLL